MQAQQQAQEQLQQLEALVKARMTKDAILRYGNIKAADPEKAAQLLLMLAQAIQAGQLESIDDALLKKILTRLAPKKRETKIIRK